MKKRTASVFLALCLALSAFLGGCGVDQSEEELEKIEYTVVKPNEIPEGLMEQIKEKEQAGFELSFQDQNYLYVVKGYGEQATGGYCVQVEKCYLAPNQICVKTVLVGPQVGEAVTKAPSFPYIVLKMELREEKVKFL